jgi:hypothetical protein
MSTSNTAAVQQLALTIYNAMPLPARHRTSLENVIDIVETMFALNMGISRVEPVVSNKLKTEWDEWLGVSGMVLASDVFGWPRR